jgi:hypothetical protein
MRRYCRIQGHFVEARSWLQEILALLTNALVGLGAIYSQLGNYRLATSTLATATAAATAIQYTLERFKRWTYDRAIEVARAAMPADDFEAGWRRGARDGSRRGCQDGARVTSAVTGGRRFLPRNAVVGE